MCLQYLTVVSSIRVLGNANVILAIIPYNEILGSPDSYGCFPSAGYEYCNYTNTCQRFDEICSFIKIAKK